MDAAVAVAASEFRGARRRWRTWLCVGVGVVVLFVLNGFYTYAHAEMSGDAAMAFFSPRFGASYGQAYVLWLLLAGLLLVAFDVPHRDRRERMADVLDARPVSNVAVLFGRLAGIVLAAWLPLAAACALIQVLGLGARVSGLWFGQPVEPYAQAAFVFLDALPVMVLWVAAILFLSAFLRGRLAVMAVAVVVLSVQMWAHTSAPAYLAAVVSPLSANVGWASDMVPRLADATSLVQRAAGLLAAVGLVVLAAAADRRADGANTRRRVAMGLSLAALGVTVTVLLGVNAESGNRLRSDWLARHGQASQAAVPDLVRLTGDIHVVPGDELRAALEMHFRVHANPVKAVVFSLNPGMQVEDLHLDGKSVFFRHDHGLLVIESSSSLSGTRLHTLELTVAGVPDARFAYLDSAVDWQHRPVTNRIGLLGTESLIFDRRYVALMPDGAWLPRAGPNVASGGRGTDFFTMDLAVRVPAGWSVAGPGRGLRDPDHSETIRFAPDAPVPDVALFAGPYKRVATDVRGVELELLLHTGHLDNVAFFADVGDRLESRVDELLLEAEQLGLAYPYDGLSVVEVPSRLRTYRGGWRMPTAMALPGVLLLREQGLPVANFERRFRDASVYEGWDGGIAAGKVWALRVYTFNDRGGGDLLAGFANQLFGMQTAAAGSGADVVDMVTRELVSRLLLESNNIPIAKEFSAHQFDAPQYLGAPIGEVIRGAVGGYIWHLPRIFYPLVDRPSVWEFAARVPLAELPNHPDHRGAREALLLKGTAMARSLYDGLGRQGAAAMLAGIRKTYAGAAFGTDSLAAAPELNRLLGDWLAETGMPGLHTSAARMYRLSDESDGTPRYQILAHVRNDESVPGVVRISDERWNVVQRGTAPIRIEGHESLEVGWIVPTPPNQLWLHSHLSLNRQSVRIALPNARASEVVSSLAPFEGARPVDWHPNVPSGIIVDDLDAGFTVQDEAGGLRLRGGLGDAFRLWEVELDQGLPVWERQRGEWSRRPTPTAWGKYRHTAVQARRGAGSRKVAFTAELPAPGDWTLYYHVPDRHLPAPDWADEETEITSFGALGVMDLRLVSGGVEIPVAFDASAAETGWAKVGVFKLAQRNVRLVVSNRTDGETVIADAIRWLPAVGRAASDGTDLP